MLKGLSLVELAQKITAQSEMKHDLLASTAEAEVEVQDDGKAIMAVAGHGSFPILPLAHDQIGSRLNIPAKYYDRMLIEQPKLLADNVNTWLHAKPERRMLRTLGGDLRAFLSDRYNRIENEEIASTVLPILAAIPGVQIVSAEVTEKRLYIQAVSPRVQGEVKLNDAVQAGVCIQNSEVGCGAVSVSALVWRLRCLNGMVLPDDKYRAYHVGRRVEDNAALWADDTLKADDRAVLLKVRDMVKLAVDEASFAKRVERMSGLANSAHARAPEKAVEVLARKVGANESEKNGILRALIEGGDLSAWGFLNAVTAQGHNAEASYDRAVDFEIAGGSLLALPAPEWKEILEAA